MKVKVGDRVRYTPMGAEGSWTGKVTDIQVPGPTGDPSFTICVYMDDEFDIYWIAEDEVVEVIE